MGRVAVEGIRTLAGRVSPSAGSEEITMTQKALGARDDGKAASLPSYIFRY